MKLVLMTMLAAVACACAGARPGLRHVNPPTLHLAKWFTQVVSVSGGRTIYVSGQAPVDKEGKSVGAGDLTAQTRQVFENMKMALTAVDATMNDVIKITVFLSDMSQIPKFRVVRDEYFQSDPPASSAVEVRALVRPEWMLEVDAIAVAR